MTSEQAYTKVRALLDPTREASFYNLPSQIRGERWAEINAAMEEVLTYTYISHNDAASLERGKLLWKLSALRDNALLVPWIVEKFYKLAEEGAAFTQLDNTLEDLQMGHEYDTQEWMTCSALIGIITADYCTSDQKQRDYGKTS